MADAQQEQVPIKLTPTAEKEGFVDKFEFLNYGLWK
jgi:hypothetical protein